MPSFLAIPANSVSLVINSSCFFAPGIKTLTRVPNEAKNIGKVDRYITAKNVPPITINIDGVSINAPIPPEDTMAPAIIPRVPINPINDAISIFLPFYI